MKKLVAVCLCLALALAAAACSAADTYHAYFGVQGTDTYVFRNAWSDNYGLNDTVHPYFDRLTGWDGGEKAEDGSVNYGGEFTDAEITGSGDYTVTLTTGEMGFGETKAFNMLFVSTDIPGSLVSGGTVKIENIRARIGSEAEELEIPVLAVDASGKYVTIYVINTYNGKPAFEYTVPGANDTITISFTVSGL